MAHPYNMQLRGGPPEKKRINITPRQRNILIAVLLSFLFLLMRGPSQDSGKKGTFFDDKEQPVTVTRGTDWSDDRMSGLDVGPKIGEIPPDQPRTGLREGEIPEAVQVGGAKKAESRLSQLSTLFGGGSESDAAMFDGTKPKGEPDTFVNGVYFPEVRPEWAGPERKKEGMAPAVPTEEQPAQAEAPTASAPKKLLPKKKKAKPEFKMITVPSAGQSSVSSKASYKPVDIPNAPVQTGTGAAAAISGKSSWKAKPRVFRDETGNATVK